MGKESVESDGEEILMSGFLPGQSISMVSALPEYSEDQSNPFSNPVYSNPSSDYTMVATTTQINSGATLPTLLYHQTRPIINLPWTAGALSNVELTEDGIQLIRIVSRGPDLRGHNLIWDVEC